MREICENSEAHFGGGTDRPVNIPLCSISIRLRYPTTIPTHNSGFLLDFQS